MSSNYRLIFSAVLVAFFSIFLFLVKLKFLINVDAYELVTTLLAFYSLFLNWRLLLKIVFVFNFLVGIFYGFGFWWLTYWYMWYGEAFLTIFLRKILIKNNIFMGVWIGFLGFSVWMWYFPTHLALGGLAYALSLVPGALIVNGIEAAFNFSFAIILFYPIYYLFLTWNKIKERETKVLCSKWMVQFLELKNLQELNLKNIV